MEAKKNTGISVFQRYLTVWVILCMAAGVAIGKYLPQIPDFLNKFTFAGISVPIGNPDLADDLPHDDEGRFPKPQESIHRSTQLTYKMIC